MNIEIRFGISDRCYFLHNNKIEQGIIEGVSIDIGKQSSIDKVPDKMTVIYTILEDNQYLTRFESEVFKTKKELIESL